VFLLAHELGHALKKHRTDLRDAVQRRRQEIEADEFAIEIMRRIAQVPLGLEFWFDLERIRHVAPAKFPTEAEWQNYLAGLRHPVTNEGLQALAAAIEKAPDSFARNQTNQALWTQRSKMFAQMFRMSAPFAANPVARVAEYSRVRELRLADLKPRKAGFIAPGTTGKEQDFSGLFRARRAAKNGTDEIDLLLLRDEDEVIGSYTTANVEGSIKGKIADGVLHFTWSEGDAQGRGKAESQGETLRGYLGNRPSGRGRR
jgi:hypothetical protein